MFESVSVPMPSVGHTGQMSSLQLVHGVLVRD